MRQKQLNIKEGFLTISQATKQLGISRQWLNELIKKGELSVDSTHSPALISDDNLNEFIRRRKRKENGYVSVTRASKILGIPVRMVSYLAKSGIIKSEPLRDESTWILINKESLKDVPPGIKFIKTPGYVSVIPEGFITSPAAAIRLCTSTAVVCRLAKSGRLEHIEITNGSGNKIYIKEPCMLRDLITIDQACQRLNSTERKIWNLIESNKIEFIVNNDKCILIFANSLEKIARRKSARKVA